MCPILGIDHEMSRREDNKILWKTFKKTPEKFFGGIENGEMEDYLIDFVQQVWDWTRI